MVASPASSNRLLAVFPKYAVGKVTRQPLSKAINAGDGWYIVRLLTMFTCVDK